MYSPRIYKSLVPCLHLTARDRGIPMTQLVNGMIYRALATEFLSPEVDLQLPAPHETGLAGRALSAYRVLPLGRDRSVLSELLDSPQDREEVFTSMRQIDHWRSHAIRGIRYGLGLAYEASRAPCKRDPNELKSDWKHKTAALFINQIYTESTTLLLAQQHRSYPKP